MLTNINQFLLAMNDDFNKNNEIDPRRHAIKNALKNSHAVGNDEIPVVLVKRSVPEFVVLLDPIIKEFLELRAFLRVFKSSITKLIHENEHS